MTPPVLCVVGPSKSGKTLVMESLIRDLASRGYRVGAVKHTPHGFQMDPDGTDSARMRAAGAARAAVVAQGEWAFVESAGDDLSLERVQGEVGRGCDIVIAEGFRSSGAPKVMVVPPEPDPDWSPPQGIVAVVADEPVMGVPWRCGFGELERLAGLIRSRFLEGEGEEGGGAEVSLAVDGRPVPLKPFASTIIAGVIQGMVGGLRGVPREPSSLQVDVVITRGPRGRAV